MKHVVIIGNGIAGVTAARHIRKGSDCRITIISEETPHFFSRTALMYVYMGHMKFEHIKPYSDDFWAKNSIDLLHQRVDEVTFSQSHLVLSDGSTLAYDELVLATGSKYNLFNWPGQDLKGVQGLYSYADLELLEKNTHAYNAPRRDRRVSRAVIVGGGLVGIELAEMLRSREIEVVMLVREGHYWGDVLPAEEAAMIQRHMSLHGVEVMVNTELKQIIADDDGRVKSIETNRGEKILCELVGLTAGVQPNVAILKNTELEIDRGILVNEHLQTNIPHVYAVGDCAQLRNPRPGRKAVEPVWYVGRMMGEVVAENICGKPSPYLPGPWFNSAKFFEIEYQIYGEVPVVLNPELDSFYWENKNINRALRFVFDRNSRQLIGVNSLGIRLRHAMLDLWLSERQTIEFVMEHLRLADFETEFYKRHWKEVVAAFNKQFGTNVKLAPFRWKTIFSNFKTPAQ